MNITEKIDKYLGEGRPLRKNIIIKEQPKTWRELGHIVNSFIVDGGMKISDINAKEISKKLGIKKSDVVSAFDALMWDEDISKPLPKIK